MGAPCIFTQSLSLVCRMFPPPHPKQTPANTKFHQSRWERQKDEGETFWDGKEGRLSLDGCGFFIRCQEHMLRSFGGVKRVVTTSRVENRLGKVLRNPETPPFKSAQCSSPWFSFRILPFPNPCERRPGALASPSPLIPVAQHHLRSGLLGTPWLVQWRPSHPKREVVSGSRSSCHIPPTEHFPSQSAC